MRTLAGADGQCGATVEVQLLTPALAADVLGGEWLVRRLQQHGWLSPVLEEHRCTRYHVADVKAAAARLRLEKLPPMERKGECDD